MKLKPMADNILLKQKEATPGCPKWRNFTFCTCTRVTSLWRSRSMAMPKSALLKKAAEPLMSYIVGTGNFFASGSFFIFVGWAARMTNT